MYPSLTVRGEPFWHSLARVLLKVAEETPVATCTRKTVKRGRAHA
jgi:hypothetical protein